MDWSGVFSEVDASEGGIVQLEPLVKADTQKWDRDFGLCPIPLYDFEDDDWEDFRAGREGEGTRDRLKTLGIEQYFNPPTDQIALGLVDRGITQSEKVLETTEMLPELGHPLAPPEFTPGALLMETVDALTDRGFLVEGEMGLEVTEAGRTIRRSVKFRPREGALSKLLKANLKFSLGDGWFSQHTKL